MSFLSPDQLKQFKDKGYVLHTDNYFDTIRVKCDSKKILDLGLKKGYNFWNYGDSIGISFDETVEISDVKSIIDILVIPSK